MYMYHVGHYRITGNGKKITAFERKKTKILLLNKYNKYGTCMS